MQHRAYEVEYHGTYECDRATKPASNATKAAQAKVEGKVRASIFGAPWHTRIPAYPWGTRRRCSLHGIAARACYVNNAVRKDQGILTCEY
jgi:hypothetical protein